MLNRGLIVHIGLILCLARGVSAQWASQTIHLTPGWNAIVLQVKPEPGVCEDFWAGVDVESVWLHNDLVGAPQFIQSPSQLTPDDPAWLVYYPKRGIGAPATNLNRMVGGRCYLVKLAGTAPATLQVKGRPTPLRMNWAADRFSLVGLPVGAGATMTLAEYFSTSDEHASLNVFGLNAEGQWRKLAGTTVVEPGRVYQVYSSGVSDFTAPVEVSTAYREGVVFGDVLNRSIVTLRNRTGATRTLTIRQSDSEAPPDGWTVAVAGSLPLYYYKLDLTGGVDGYVSLPSELTMELAPYQTKELELGLRRNELPPYSLAAPYTGAIYQGVLTVTDDRGLEYILGANGHNVSMIGQVDAFGNPPIGDAEAAGLISLTNDDVHPRAGLWVGVVTVNAVNEPRVDPSKLVPTAIELSFRVIVHVNGLGQARLLREALIMFKRGTSRPSSIPGFVEVETPGEYVVITDESLLTRTSPDGKPLYTGTLLREGKTVGRRISSSCFAFNEPMDMTEGFGVAGQAAAVEIAMGFNDRLNPFKHIYHPDHDNKDPNFEPYPEGGAESFDINRLLTFEFTESDPRVNPNEGVKDMGFGATTVGGVYREELTGVHKETIRAQGTFRLERILKTPVLNDGQ